MHIGTLGCVRHGVIASARTESLGHTPPAEREPVGVEALRCGAYVSQWGAKEEIGERTVSERGVSQAELREHGERSECGHGGRKQETG